MTPEILIAIVSAFAGGFITFLFRVLSDKRKEKREDRLEAKKLQREAFQNRPEMQIVNYKDYVCRPGYGIKQKCDIDLFVARISQVSLEGRRKDQIVRAHFCGDDLNPENWCCVIYTLKNAGKTDISRLDIICHFQQTTCIFPSQEVKQWEDGGLLNYAHCYDRKVRVGETITLKLCYYKDHIVPSAFSAAISIGMVDDNGRHWTQPLFAPQDKAYDSRPISSKEYHDELNTDTAEECFKKPWLW